nr:Na+/H+ antiporter [Naumannella cuiyingiana]
MPYLIAVVVAVLVTARLARAIALPAPLLLVAVGVIASYVPFVPQEPLDAELVLVGLLPPLLYAAARQSSLIELKNERWKIAFLSVGMTLFTTIGIGLLAWWLLPIPLPAGLALGAIVAPPDAVAASAIGRRIGLPRRVVTWLEGESLFNDATALVALRTAIVALSATVSPGEVALDFVIAAGGGIAIGVILAIVINRVLRVVRDPVSTTAITLITPYLAYLPAEAVEASGVVAVVVTGVIVAHQAPRVQSAAARTSTRVNWATIQFLLENAVFLLIGLQARWIIDAVIVSPTSTVGAIEFALIALVAVFVLRPIWNLIGWPLLTRGERIPMSYLVITSWAGMRGVVTLAAALTLPADTPLREVLILTAMVVTAGTLGLQSLTLPALARRLGVRGPDPREDALQEAILTQHATDRGIAALDATDDIDDEIRQNLRNLAERRSHIAWEQLADPDGEYETPSEAYRRVRMKMLDAEREELLRLRTTDGTDQEAVKNVLAGLDLEETALEVAQVRHARRSRELETEPPGGDCAELRAAPHTVAPDHPETCPDCERDGTNPVQLRICLACGHVGCCDSSVGRHATRHFEETGHPVMRSFEPGESWRWCYRHRITG